MSRPKDTLVQKALASHKLINEIGFPALSETEIVRRTIYLANDCTDEEKEAALFAGLLSHGIPQKNIAQIASIHGGDFLRAKWNEIRDEREQFREQVSLVYEDREAARKALRREIEDAIRSVAPVPKLSLTDNWRLELEVRYISDAYRPACAFALALLLDESRKLGAALRICNLGPCQNYFLSLPAPAGGRPPVYCTPSHQAMNSAQTGAERTERWRRKKAQEKGKKS
jgi:hypothetical protein